MTHVGSTSKREPVRRDPILRIDRAIGGSTTQRVIQRYFAVFSSRWILSKPLNTECDESGKQKTS